MEKGFLTSNQLQTCCSCSLHTVARKNVCVPTEVLSVLPSRPILLFLGMNPGHNEDAENRPFSPNGKSGRLLREVLIPGPSLHLAGTLVLMNVARCLSGPKPPTHSQYDTCFRSFSSREIEGFCLSGLRLLAICLGADVTSALHRRFTGRSLSMRSAFSSPLRTYTTPSGKTFQALSTYHPAGILRQRRLIHAARDHLILARDWAHSIVATPSTPTIVPPYPPPPD